MAKEEKALIISMIINFIVSLMKVIVGIFSLSKSIIADGFHSISDFITDIIAFFGSKISKKRANKKYPVGLGRVEYLIDILIATVILILGIFTIYRSFTEKAETTNIIWLGVVILSIILKYINSRYLKEMGIKCNSPILITSSKESHDEMESTIGVMIIILISQFSRIFPILVYADTIGGIIIGLLIIKTSLKLFEENILLILGKTEHNVEIRKKIQEVLNKYKGEIEYEGMDLVRNGSYYTLDLDIKVLKDFKVHRLLFIESEIRNKIKKLHYRIKFIDINLNPIIGEEKEIETN